MKKVLVVDNNPVLLKAVSSILEKLGCEVQTAKNGLNALEKLELFSPEIIFTDLIMPHVSGEQLCKIIKNTEKFKDIYLVVLSAVIEEDLERVLSSIEYDLCIMKGTLKEMRENLTHALKIYDEGGKGNQDIIGVDTTARQEKSDVPSLTSELLTEKHHLSRMIANLSEGVVELTVDGKIVSVNSAAISIVGQKEEQLLGKDFSGLSLGKHQKEIKQWVVKQLQNANEVSLELYETDPLLINGKVATASFLPIVDKEHCFGIVILRDITRQFRAEEHKNKLDESFRLMKKMEAMSSMAGGVAHDFNNLLTVICGNLDILAYSKNKLEFLEKKALVGHAQQAAYAATDLVRKISCFSSFGIIHREKMCVGPLVSVIVKKFFKRDGSEFDLDINSPDSLVNIDKEQIETAIRNVLLNAQEAGGQRKIKVKTSSINLTAPQLLAGQYVPAGKFVRIDVIDTGIGIPSKKVLEIFDPYFSSKSRGSDKGMGLGLTVVYATLRNHGGYVVVQSEHAKGTTVSFFLPYFGEGELNGFVGTSEISKVKKLNVLLMEDEEPLRDIGAIMLEYLGYRVTAVSSKKQAIDVFKRSISSVEDHFDVAVLNIYGEDGEEGVSTCKELQKIKPDFKTIASSGAILHQVMADCKEYGFSATLPKPYTMDNLKHALESVLVD